MKIKQWIAKNLLGLPSERTAQGKFKCTVKFELTITKENMPYITTQINQNFELSNVEIGLLIAELEKTKTDLIKQIDYEYEIDDERD